MDAKRRAYLLSSRARGKAEIKVAGLLSHTSGVRAGTPPSLDETVRMGPVDAMLGSAGALVGARSGIWLPDGLSYGHMIGEVIRCIPGQSPGEFLGEMRALARLQSACPRSSIASADLVPWPMRQPDPAELTPNCRNSRVHRPGHVAD